MKMSSVSLLFFFFLRWNRPPSGCRMWQRMEMEERMFQRRRRDYFFKKEGGEDGKAE